MGVGTFPLKYEVKKADTQFKAKAFSVIDVLHMLTSRTGVQNPIYLRVCVCASNKNQQILDMLNIIA